MRSLFAGEGSFCAVPSRSLVILFFKQKTAYEMRISDGSSDVCSSDLRVRPFLKDVEIGPRRSSRGGRRLAGSDQAPVLSEHAAFLGRCVPLESLPSHRSSTKKAAPPGAVNPGAPGRAAGKPGEPRSRQYRPCAGPLVKAAHGRSR